MLKLIMMMPCICFLAGCSTVTVPNYCQAKWNIEAIKTKSDEQSISVRLNEFTTSGYVPEELTCRGVIPLVPTSGKTYEKYIRDALHDELVLAGIYKDTAKVTLDGNLDSLDFSSGMTDAEWNITLSVKSSTGIIITVSEKFRFGSSCSPANACVNTANVFPYAVQSLIGSIVAHPDFTKLVSAR